MGKTPQTFILTRSHGRQPSKDPCDLFLFETVLDGKFAVIGGLDEEEITPPFYARTVVALEISMLGTQSQPWGVDRAAQGFEPGTPSRQPNAPPRPPSGPSEFCTHAVFLLQRIKLYDTIT